MKTNSTIDPVSKIQNVDFDNLGFGVDFTDKMVICDFENNAWGDFEILPLKNFELHPAASIFHYGQSIFEGLKAYKGSDGRVNVFRLKDNLQRLVISAERMQMQCPPIHDMFDVIMQWVAREKAWVPNRDQGTLYIRPYLIGTSNTLRAKPSDNYRFGVIGSPVGFYYPHPISVKLEEKYKRSAPGGVGFAKAGGNYAASFYPSAIAHQEGFDQLIWTDTTEQQNIEELGSANIFVGTSEGIFTPPASDTILAGITRDTIISLAKELSIHVVEQNISKNDLLRMLIEGKVTSLFATGTAAAVTYINSIKIGEQAFTLQSEKDEKVDRLKNTLQAIRFGEIPENHNWCNWV